MADASSSSTALGKWLPRLGLLSLLLTSVALGVACGAEDDAVPPVGLSTGSGGSTASSGPGGGCTDGDTQDCHITLGQHEGVLSCYDGTQTCEGGAWGPCGDGTVSMRPAPGGGGEGAEEAREGQQNAKPLSLSDAGPCQNNPCDPTCQTFDELPDGGVKPDASGSIYDWQTGDLTGYPIGLVKKGLKEPCSTGADCQFNHHCDNPKAGSCAHHKCVTGKGLLSTCDPCVTQICANTPSCCAQPITGTCLHPLCDQGGALKTGCHACVNSICAVDPYCCNTFWDGLCVAEVQSVCGLSCSTGNWTQACVDQVETVCNAFCEEDAACNHDKCYVGPGLNLGCDPCVDQICAIDPACCGQGTCTHNACDEGNPLVAGCDPCVASICAADPYCCNTWWDSICVGEVSTVCGASCPLAGGQTSWSSACVAKVASVCGETCPQSGQCEPWLPGETNPDCPGVNLTLGVSCGSGAPGSIPVCNVGNTQAPAGVKLIHFPANSGAYPKCAPDQTHPQKITCTTSQPIPPGECINVTNCAGLVGNREIMVNPPGVGAIAECQCNDNWSLFNSNACGEPSCSGAGSTASFKKVNMFVTFDKSGSMAGARWNDSTAALKGYFADPASAGIGVALRFWPDNTPSVCDTPSCSFANCSQPMVPLGTLTAAVGAADPQEQALINAINSKAPGGVTPMYAALGGATQWATSYQTANPTEQAIVVLITDGQPNGCDTNINNIANLAANAFNNFGVQTYVIGIAGVAPATINQIASAGGGQAFFIASGADTKAELTAAMKAIQGEAATCVFDLPNPGLFDPAGTSVYYTPSMGAVQTLPRVTNAAACGGGGWYFDDNMNPQSITLCPSTCMTIQADQGASVEVVAACPPAYDPVTFKEVYAPPACPQGQQIQWGFFAYDTTTPGDSNVLFQARTATTQAGLASAPLVTLGTAKATPNTQVCAMGGPAPCPIDIFNALGGLPEARYPFLELVYTINPTSDQSNTATVHNWEITYSCPDAE